MTSDSTEQTSRESYSEYHPVPTLPLSLIHHPLGFSAVPRSFLNLDLSGSAPPSPISSRLGMIHVFSYTPAEGEQDVPITVKINFLTSSSNAVYVRLVVGRKAVATHVRQLANPTAGRWQLEAAAPPFDRNNSTSARVSLTVQALNEHNSVLDSVTFGEFTYWESSRRDYHCPSEFGSIPCKEEAEEVKLEPTSPDSSPQNSPVDVLSTPPLGPADHSLSSKARQKRPVPVCKTSNSLMRTRHLEGFGNGYVQRATLELLNSLDRICYNWEDSEFKLGRRLVRFHKELHGHNLRVSCEAITQEAYSSSDIVISCIHRAEAYQFFVTSVDIIYLLEKLVDSHFEVEEKNRIRRNLEGLKPITVSKNRPGFESFFQRIMDFPDPRPRNIEKDLKVFEWKLLAAALEKIISKYSLYSDTPFAPGDPGGEDVADAPIGTTYNVKGEREPTPPDVGCAHPYFARHDDPSAACPHFLGPPALPKAERPADELPFSPAASAARPLYYPVPVSPEDSPVETFAATPQLGAAGWSPAHGYGYGYGYGYGLGPAEPEDPAVFEVVQTAYLDNAYALTTFDTADVQTLREVNMVQPDGFGYLDGCFHSWLD